MIPKIIHYCWFGNNEKPELVKMCIENWKKYLPDYEIKEWNEDNFNINLCEYTRQAYDNEKWAFVSDVARIYAIYEYGGIYLDTDVELYKSLDCLLNYDAFFSFENERSINTGRGCGAEKNNLLFKKILDDYKCRSFFKKGKMNLSETCSHINTPIIQKTFPEFKKNDEFQLINNIAFLNTGYINNISKHYGERTWLKDFKKESIKKHGRVKSNLLHKLRNPKIFEFIGNNLGSKSEKIYEFFVYDFFDLGILYYIKRILKN